MPRKKTYNKNKEVRSMARERVGTVKAARVIQPAKRKPPRYKEDALREEEQ